MLSSCSTFTFKILLLSVSRFCIYVQQKEHGIQRWTQSPVFNQYLAEVRRYPSLHKKKNMNLLFGTWKMGMRKPVVLIKSNLRLVVKMFFPQASVLNPDSSSKATWTDGTGKHDPTTKPTLVFQPMRLLGTVLHLQLH